MKNKMLDMSISFLTSSVDCITKDSPSAEELKFSIIHLYSAVELLLKSSLMDEHWSLVFRDIKEAKRQKLEEGDLVTVTVDEAIRRLQNICEKKFNSRQLKLIKKMGNERNRIVHFSSDISREHALALLLDTHNFIVDFIADNNIFDSSDDLDAAYEEIKSKINSQKQYIEKRLNSIKSEIGKHEFVLKCPNCWQVAVPMNDDSFQCLFCRSSFENDDFYDQYASYFLNDYPDESQTYSCPDCGSEGVVYSEELDNLVCLYCHTIHKGYSVCEDCGELMDASNDRICGDCVRNRLDYDRPLPAPSFPED